MMLNGSGAGSPEREAYDKLEAELAEHVGNIEIAGRRGKMSEPQIAWMMERMKTHGPLAEAMAKLIDRAQREAGSEDARLNRRRMRLAELNDGAAQEDEDAK
jgi:hypothetical protein